MYNLIYNGYDFNRIPSLTKSEAVRQVGFKDGMFNIIMVTSLRYCISKDPMTFIKTAKYLEDIVTDVHFYMAGDGDRKEDIDIYLDNNNLSNVTMLGSRDDVELLFLASDLSVLTSNTEGISNSIIESMAYGTPVIATSAGGTLEVIEHGVDGFIEPFEDYKAIANRILQLKNNMALYEQISKNAKTKIKDKFDIDVMIKKFIEIISPLKF